MANRPDEVDFSVFEKYFNRTQENDKTSHGFSCLLESKKGDKEVPIKTLNDSDSSEQEHNFCRMTTGPLGRSAVKDACVSRRV